MIPAPLIKVQEYLSKSPVRLRTGGGDSRRESGDSEQNVISALQNQQSQLGLSIISPNTGQSHNRAWYDVKIAEHYCDIKISELNSADNTNAKMAIFYFLTGKCKDEGFAVPVQEEKFFPLMRENEMPDERRDYYYIVVNKNDTSDVFIVSLKGLGKLRSSANNHPFQCEWDNNRTPVQRTWNEAKDFLLSHWATSIRRKMKTLAAMPTNYPEYFEKQ